MKTLFIIISLLISLSVSAIKPQKIYTKEQFTPLYDSLLKTFGQHKILPKGFELATLVALSHYPELKNTRIRFILKETFIPLVSRPKFTSMIRRKSFWEYQVIISDHSNEEMETILLKNLSFNAQVGIIGHELGHTAYYLDKSIGELMSIGFNYLYKPYRANFEKDTDRRAVDHGLGWQLYDYAIYSRSLPSMTRENIDWINQFYLSGSKILEYMKSQPLYERETTNL